MYFFVPLGPNGVESSQASPTKQSSFLNYGIKTQVPSDPNATESPKAV